MKLSNALHTAAALSAAAILLSACSNAPQNSFGLTPIDASAKAAVHRIQLAGTTRVLYVTDGNNNTVSVLHYRTWKLLSSFQSAGPAGEWVDNKGNLYVANSQGPNITEYDPSGNVIFTYSACMGQPFAVTTDRFGTVYEADMNGYVSEYSQGNNYPAATCTPANNSSGVVTGVAVENGNVFAVTGSSIIEYRHGLISSHCIGTVLPISLVFGGGIAIDPQSNLVVSDSQASAVYIIAPPYTSVTGTLGTGWSEPYGVSISKDGTQVYVADINQSNVRVLTYPAGSNVATLGFERPFWAVDSKNFVP